MTTSNLPDNLPQLPPEKGVWDEKAVGRRSFLERVFGLLAGMGVLAVAVPSLRFLAGNSLELAKIKWVEMGKLEALPPEQVTRVNYSTSAPDAWRNVDKRGTVYVYSDDGGASYVALDGSCTHLGCIVQWKEGEQHYACPCHAGFFTRAGQVVSGPPPKALRRLAVKVENGVVYAEL